jgi:hypothetical protein
MNEQQNPQVQAAGTSERNPATEPHTAEVYATWDDCGDFYRMPIAFALRKGRLKRVKPVQEVNGFDWGTLLFYANLVIDLEEDYGKRHAYVRFCNLPRELCERLEEAAEEAWKKTGRIDDAAEAVVDAYGGSAVT